MTDTPPPYTGPDTALVPPAATQLTPGFFRLASVLQGLLRLGALLALAEIGYYAWAVTVFNGWIHDLSTYKLVTAQLLDDLARFDAIATFLMVLVTGVVFIVWLYRASRSDRVSPAWMRRGAGWAIGGWFIPLANLVLPYQQVSDLHRAAFVARGEGKPVPEVPLVRWWWGTWIGAGIVSWVALAQQGDPTSEGIQVLRDIRGADTAELVGAVLTLAAALLAATVVGRITTLLRRP